ncbi:MAG: NADH-quinone oxidoreductase subunit NuoN [Burkholderiales bacterium]|nr:NADH-quinone oxidoreductase subunit NuoN [Burkholderiales bacterium]
MLPAYAEIFLLAAACAILILDVYCGERWRGLSYALSLATLAGCAVCTAYVMGMTGGEVAYTFNGMFVSDRMASVLKLFAYLGVALCLVYSRAYLRERNLLKGEYFVLVLLATLGMMVMMSANHFLTVYLGLELMSLCLYTLVALNRESTAATEAAMKYFVLGALASGLLLYGMSILYGTTGSLEITSVANALRGGASGSRTILAFGLVFLVAGIAFKLGVVPFHMWIPDVYHGAPTAVTLFLGAAPKLAAFAMAMRLLVGAAGSPPLALDWQMMLVLLSVLSMAVGNLAAIAQSNIKRMLAYSTIAHMGFMLLGLASGVVDGNRLSAPGAYGAAMFYALTYMLMSLVAFGMVVVLSRAGYEAEHISDFRGLNRRSPWFAAMMMLAMFSLAGIPPLVGFYAKLAVLSAVIEAGHVWLAVVAVAFSLIGAFYYLRVVKLMYFDEPTQQGPVRPQLDTGVLLSANGLALLALGVFPGALMQLCLSAIKGLGSI